jgi:predicted secreted protein
MSKSNSVGTKLNIGTGGGAVTVGGLTSISGVEISAETIDVTALDNATGYREKIPGFKEVGDVSVSGFLDGSDQGQDQMYTLLNSQAETTFEIIFPTKINKKWTFSGYVSAFSTSADIGDAITFEATIIVTGQATLAATTTV